MEDRGWSEAGGRISAIFHLPSSIFAFPFSSCLSSCLRAFVAPTLLLLLATTASAQVKGVSLAHAHRGGGGYGSDACRRQLQVIKDLGANWIAVNDYAWMGGVNEPAIRFRRDGRPQEGDMERAIRDARALGLKVLVKPHLWSRDFGRAGKWHGDIRMTSEADWDAWFADYTEYVLNNARLAQRTGAEALCVGVEYLGTSDQESRWRDLIAAVRKEYTGHVTYAASFLEWQSVKWWDAVDCIGVDAYFPVATTTRAGDDELRAGWERVYAEILPVARRWNKPVCFLEIGYSASIKAGQEPWAYDVVEPDVEYQARLYKVALEMQAKHSDTVVGVFAWKWFTSDRPSPREPFVIQDRLPVLQVLARAWGGTAPTTMPSTAATTRAAR